MRKHGRSGSLLCAAIAVAIAALIGAAGFGSTVLAQQPQTTGMDWFGTIKKTAKGGGHNHNIEIKFQFDVDPDGSINAHARARARITAESDSVPGCTILWTYSPSEFDIPLSGRRDGENFEIAIDPGAITATISLAGACAAGQPSNTFPGHLNPAVHADTKYRIPVRDGATNTVERTVGALPWGVNMRDTIEIHLCGSNMPERGVVYAAQGYARVYAAPSAVSSMLGSEPGGTRVNYTQTRQVNGQIWLFYSRLGQGRWVRASDFLCGNPFRPRWMPPPQSPEQQKLSDDAARLRPVAATVAGARG